MTPEEIRAMQLRGYGPRPTDPVMPSMDPTRLSIRDLEALLQTTQGRPIDYSKVAEVAKAREDLGARQMIGGMAMSMLGGESLKPHGAQIFKNALELRTPLRANAADVGYVNPETGEFVENPQAARVRDEKVIAGRLDARIREEEARARLALSQGDKNSADIARQNSETMKLILAGIAQQNADSNARRAEAAEERARASSNKPPKPLQAGQVRDLDKNVANHTSLVDLRTSFKDNFSGMGPLSTAQVAIETAAGGLAPASSQERAGWWQKFKMYQELPTRHELFGATLTAGESAAWAAAQRIHPRSSPAEVRKAVDMLIKAVEDRQDRLVRQFRVEGKDPSVFEIERTVQPGVGASGEWTDLGDGIRVREKKK